MRVPAHRIHHKIAVYTDPFEVDAGHTTAICDQSCGLCGANVESRFAFDGTPQSRIEHWTSTQDHEQVLVAGLAFGPVREEVRLIELADAQPNQIGVHVWESVSQDPPIETEEVVWLTELRHRYAIASEDDVGIGRRAGRISVDEDHVVPSTAQEEGSGHAGDAAAEHEHLHEGGRYPRHSDGATGPASSAARERGLRVRYRRASFPPGRNAR
jgi:hypothetical protein